MQMSMDWSNDSVLEFLDYYQNEPIIWNPNLPNHNKRHDVHDAWKRIRTQMGGKFTVSDLKRKKDSLMASFRTCLSKVKNSIRNGATGQDIYKPSWFAYEKMAGFLMDRDQLRNTLKTEAIFSFEETMIEEDTNDPLEMEKQVSSDTETNTVISIPMKRKKSYDAEDPKKKPIAACSTSQLTTEKSSLEKNMCDIYGELVSTKLKLMDEKSREICMHRISSILFEMNMKQFSYNNVNCTLTTLNSPGGSEGSHIS